MHEHIYCPEGKLKYNRQMFSEIAPRYDFITHALSLGRDSRWKDELVKDLPEAASPACLDLACGTGAITFRLAARYPRGRIVGLDLTEAMLAYARARNSYPNVSFTLQNMCQTGFSDNSFDIVTGGYALRNAPDIMEALAEVRRIMKPGATGVFLDFSKPASRFWQKVEYSLLKIWGGFWGLVLHGNPELYTYIAESLRQFPDTEQLKQYIVEVGFGNIRSKKYYLGMAETIVFEKPRD
jgi:demethylmenaquinone methyltransferase/2-methoxy-6-polyprenyl-1,4-benzoquinol methylase